MFRKQTKRHAETEMHFIYAYACFIFSILHFELATRYYFRALNRMLTKYLVPLNRIEKMISNSQRSATIYQFPIGGRAGLQSANADHAATQPLNEFALTDAWYHQEAIRDAKPATKQ